MKNMPEAPSRPEICPRCEEGILVTVQAPQDILLYGSVVRIPNVQTDKCPVCGFRSLSGREVALFEVLFAPQYERVSDLVAALRAAGYYSAFLREEESDSRLGFGARAYVAGLPAELKNLYLDNESAHIIENLNAIKTGVAIIDLCGYRCSVRLPKIGEGENGIVYDYQEEPDAVLKLAKPRPYSRDHLTDEYKVTEFFVRQDIPVPRVRKVDPYGSFMIKERLAGESLARLYPKLGGPDTPQHQRVRAAVQAFVERLLEIFRTSPKTKTSISPNNIFVRLTDTACECMLVDTGPAPFHDYSKFNFTEYWEVTIPQKIRQYKAAGYL